MTRNWTQDDLRELLVEESLDVDTPDRFRVRLDNAARPTRTGRRHLGLVAAAVVIAALVAVWWTGPLRRPSTPAAAPHTAHLSLRVVPQLPVTSAEDLVGREVLRVSYRPDDRESHEGGAVTLYEAGVFDAPAFLAGAEPIRGTGHDAYFGSYPYTGDWGPVLTLAWEQDDGRWVSVQNFHTENDDAGPSGVRAVDLRVAHAVIVR